MIYRTLGRTGLRVSLVGLGTGGPARIGQSAGLSAAASQRIVRTALDLGVNLFDTSPSYGGSEELLGGALRGVPRERYYITTKFQPHQGKALKTDPQALTQQLDESLRLLGVETVDVLQYHGVTPQEYPEVVERFQSVALRAQREGKLRYLGITETTANDPTHEMLARSLREDLFDVIMIKYGILNQAAERVVFPLVQEKNVGVLVMAPVRTSLRHNAEALAQINRFIDEGLLAIPRPQPDDPLGLGAAGQPIPTLTRAAYQCAAAHPAVSTVLVGTGNLDHLKANVADLTGPPLTEAQIVFLRQTYGQLAWNA